MPGALDAFKGLEVREDSASTLIGSKCGPSSHGPLEDGDAVRSPGASEYITGMKESEDQSDDTSMPNNSGDDDRSSSDSSYIPGMKELEDQNDDISMPNNAGDDERSSSDSSYKRGMKESEDESDDTLESKTSGYENGTINATNDRIGDENLCPGSLVRSASGTLVASGGNSSQYHQYPRPRDAKH